MNEWKDTDKPLVTIVMATYNPRMEWLSEQLASLNNQSYNNLELLIIDDCSSKISLEDIIKCVKLNITKIPYEISHNEQNLGSTKTFEKLTNMARGKYIAYCDQDDVWLSEKIETLLKCFNDEKVVLAYSDVIIIDGAGKIKVNSITDIRKRHILYEGDNLSDKLLVQNFVIGCSMLIKKNIAIEAIPFIKDMVHDHYLALSASLTGRIKMAKKSLVFYRIHNNNQTNTLTGIETKEEYYQKKIKNLCNRLEQFEYKITPKQYNSFTEIKKWAQARDLYYNGDLKSAKNIWKYRKFDFGISIFELSMRIMPNSFFSYVINKRKEGKP